MALSFPNNPTNGQEAHGFRYTASRGTWDKIPQTGSGITNLNSFDTDDLAEGTTNLYFTNARSDARANSRISTVVTKGYIDALDIDAGSLNNNDADYYLDYNNLTNKPTIQNKYKGAWETRTAYAIADIVIYQNNFYIADSAIPDTSTANPTNDNKWRLISSQDLKSTTDLAEGNSLYFTEERVDDRVNNLLKAGLGISLTYNDARGELTITNTRSAGGGITNLNSFDTDDLAEGSNNLYYTVARTNSDIDTRVNKAFVEGLGPDIPWADVTGKPTIPTQYTDEMVDDRVNDLLIAGHNLQKIYSDADGTLTLNVTGGEEGNASAYAYYTAPTINPLTFTQTAIGDTGSGYIYALVDDYDTPAGIIPNHDFLTEFYGFLNFEVADNRNIQIILRTKHSFNGKTLNHERVHFIDAVGGVRTSLAMNDFNSRSQVRIGTFGGVSITQADLEAAATITYEIEIKSFNRKSETTRQATTLNYLAFENPQTVSYQLRQGKVEADALSKEFVDDSVHDLLVAGDNITLTYDDAANSLTIASTQRSDASINTLIDNRVSKSFVEGLGPDIPWSNITSKPTIPSQYTDEMVDDRVNGLLKAGSNITLTYNDSANSLTIASTATGAGNASVTVADTAPASPDQGQFWFDSTSAELNINYEDDDGEQWIAVSSANGGPQGTWTISDTAPTSPVTGGIWTDTTLYKNFYYSGAVWIEI